jgi:hypothetical protein
MTKIIVIISNYTPLQDYNPFSTSPIELQKSHSTVGGSLKKIYDPQTYIIEA